MSTVDVEEEQERRRGGPTDPTGNVSSGLMPGPLRGKGGRPVADPDELDVSKGTPLERDREEENVSRKDLEG